MAGHPPTGTAPPPTPWHAAPTGHAGQGDSVGPPHPHSRAHSTWVADPNSRPSGRAVGGETAPDFRRFSQWWKAPPPWGRPPATPTASYAGLEGRTLWGRCLVPTPAPTAPGTHGSRNPGCPLQWTGGRGRDSALHKTPLTMVEGTPTGDTLLPAQQRSTPALKSARCGASAGSPRPHRPHPGHTGRGTLAARSRGRAAGGGTAPDTRRPSQQWQATPPKDGPPPPPRHAAPTGHAGQGDSVGPPHPHTCAHSTWVADPNSPKSGQAVGGGTAPDLRRPSQWWKVPPRGRPPPPHSEQSRPARAHAVGPVLGPHARTDRTRDTGVAEPWLPAPEDGRPGEGQRLTPDAPHNGGRLPPPPPPGDSLPPPPRHAASTGHAGQGDSVGPPHPHARNHSMWVADPNSPPSGRAVRGGGAPDLRRPSQRWKAPPPGMPLRRPHSEHRRPARAHAVGPVLGPHARTDRIRDTRVAEPRLPAPEDGLPGEGQRLTPDAPHNGGRPAPPGTAPHHPHGTQPPRGVQAKGTVLYPHTHTPAPTACGWRTPTARPVGGQFREGECLTTDAPHNGGRHPPGNALPPLPQQALPPSKHARCGADAGPHARTDRTRDTRVAEYRPPAPEGGRPGEGQRLTPDAPHNDGRPAPPETAPHHPHGTQPPQGVQAKGTVLGPHTHTPAPTARGWRTPTARPVGGQSGAGERLTSNAPHNGGRHPPRGCPSAPSTASIAGPQRRTLWGRCWVPTPAPTAPGKHGSRNPGCPAQRTGGRGRDSA